MLSVPPPTMFQQIVRWVADHRSLLFGLTINWVSAILSFLFLANLRAEILYFRRTIEQTDQLIAGHWCIYRYTISHGAPKLILDRWTVRRTLFSRTYLVDVAISTGSNRPQKSVGKLVYNERDRLSILFEGVDHKEQSLISFCPRLPVDDDTRMLGLGLGDDGDYMLTARPYLACRALLSEGFAKKILDDAIEALRQEAHKPTIRFSPQVMEAIFLSNPMPNDGNKSKNEFSLPDAPDGPIRKMRKLLTGAGG